jgi:hypothetical protein
MYPLITDAQGWSKTDRSGNGGNCVQVKIEE